MSFLFKSIAEYQSDLLSGQTNCVSVVEHYIQEIAAHKNLNAFVEVFEEQSLKRARALDHKLNSGDKPGKLFGVVVAIKDVICFKDHKVTAASKILEGFISLYSATAVQRLIAEDAIIIGSCNCDEFAMGSTNENSTHGKVHNALDHSKVPGGSSGGSAVAVQAGLSMVSLGSDTGGSVRQPADFCGIVGFKPGYGKISRYGLIAYASSFDQIGIFGNAIDDIETVLDVIEGPDDYDSTTSTSSNKQKVTDAKPVIGYFKNALDHPSLDVEIKQSIYDLLDNLKEAGYNVKAYEFDLLDYVVPAYYVLTTGEASSNLSRYDGLRYGYSSNSMESLDKFYTSTRSDGFGKEVKRRIMLGTFVLSAGYYDAYFTKAQQVRQKLKDRANEIFSECDMLIMPTVPATAFAINDFQKDPIAMYLADIYTVFANLVGIPGISVPLFKHSNSMPFSVQVMSNNDNELSLLSFSKSLLHDFDYRK
ncbi:MAG: Asp-tRNA(Asn)/Glu-tRNA(Gln) amidotransferase subunit GatA [Ginsengibacter sp.]